MALYDEVKALLERAAAEAARRDRERRANELRRQNQKKKGK
jgi:hypothetical protein